MRKFAAQSNEELIRVYETTKDLNSDDKYELWEIKLEMIHRGLLEDSIKCQIRVPMTDDMKLEVNILKDKWKEVYNNEYTEKEFKRVIFLKGIEKLKSTQDDFVCAVPDKIHLKKKTRIPVTFLEEQFLYNYRMLLNEYAPHEIFAKELYYCIIKLGMDEVKEDLNIWEKR